MQRLFGRRLGGLRRDANANYCNRSACIALHGLARRHRSLLVESYFAPGMFGLTVARAREGDRDRPRAASAYGEGKTIQIGTQTKRWTGHWDVCKSGEGKWLGYQRHP